MGLTFSKHSAQSPCHSHIYNGEDKTDVLVVMFLTLLLKIQFNWLEQQRHLLASMEGDSDRAWSSGLAGSSAQGCTQVLYSALWPTASALSGTWFSLWE